MAKQPQRTWFVSIRVKLLVGLTLLFSIAFVGAFWWFYTFATRMAMKQIEEDMVSTLYAGIAGIDADEFAALAAEGVPREDGLTDDPRYWDHLEWLETIHNLEPRANPYTYVRGEEPNEVLFIGDIFVVTDPDNAASFRESYISKGGMWGGLTGLNMKLEPYADAWGAWGASAYAPIENPEGEVVGAMGIDFRADYIQEVRQPIRRGVVVAFALTFPLLFGLVFLIAGTLTRPTITLTKAAEQVAEGNYKQDMSGLYAGRFRDEVATLAQVFDMMVEKVLVREESLKRQVQQLRIEIDQAKKARQVEEIVESDYFKELQSSARKMRERAKGTKGDEA